VLVIALAVHVLDEALTNFLEFYNPLVLSMRARIPWFPMPTSRLRSPVSLAGHGSVPGCVTPDLLRSAGGEVNRRRRFVRKT
jgi:hypothetical protein